jgi:chorismate synthase
MKTKKSVYAGYERSDVCAVPAASVVGLAASAFEIAGFFLEKFGGDSLREIERNLGAYQRYLKTR